MKTSEKRNALNGEAEPMNETLHALTEEELTQVEGGSWFNKPKAADDGIVSPTPGTPMCFVAKGKKSSSSFCPSPTHCAFRASCANSTTKQKI